VDYRLARIHARRGRKADAVESLRNAVRKGYADADAIEGEPDFEPLRRDQAFQEIVSRLKSP
jgi:hypothetical protein